MLIFKGVNGQVRFHNCVLSIAVPLQKLIPIIS